MMKTVVTMTCWTKRINQMPIFLDYFFATQTKKPDLFYLWLATEEFPDHILPLELLVAIQKYGVILKWVEKNEYCHKRWRVYPEHYDDVVISLDEDVKYADDLIEQAPNCKNITNLYVPNLDEHIDLDCLGICGQCIIPPKTFPMEAYDKEYINDRLEYSPKCDECWLNVFLLKNHIKVTNDISLVQPFYLRYDCSSNNSALYKNMNNKPEMFDKLIKHMTEKYNFDINEADIQKVEKYIKNS